jgi:hypothetical protein
MTQDEIIEMTREAGGFDATPEFLERFAKLVAAKEREAIAQMVEPWLLPEYVEKIRNRGQA